MSKRMAILRTITVGTMVLALCGAAFGANSSMSVASANATNDGAGAPSGEHATVNVDLSAVAASVVGALVGGSNPSTLVSQRDAQRVNAQHDDTNASEVSQGQNVGETGTSGTKPGFGCGDTNHTHSGPPGRPNASLPPGCTKQ
jgi:hypothetical protein